MSERLKKCRCGGKAEILFCEEECCGAKPRWIYCTECDTEVHSESKFDNFESEAEAIEAWNRSVK